MVVIVIKPTKLTTKFISCGQVGIDTYAEFHRTRVVEFTEEQKKLFKPPVDMQISNVIFEFEDGD